MGKRDYSLPYHKLDELIEDAAREDCGEEDECRTRKLFFGKRAAGDEENEKIIEREEYASRKRDRIKEGDNPRAREREGNKERHTKREPVRHTQILL